MSQSPSGTLINPLTQAFGIEGHAAQLLDKLPVAAYACDAEGLIVYFNKRAEELWGRAPKLNDPADRFCGSFKLFASDGSPLRHDECWMARVLQTGQAFEGEEIIVERPNGQRLAVLAHASPWRNAAGEPVGAINILIDIEEKRQATVNLAALKDELALQLADVHRLHEMSERLAATLELPSVLDEVLNTAASIVGTNRGLISLFDPDLRALKVGASLNFDDEFLAAVNETQSGSGACGSCMQTLRPVIVEDVETDPLFDTLRDVARRAGFRAVYSTPLVTRAGKFIGVLSTHFAGQRRPSDRERRLIELCARHAADCIENAQLYEQLREADRRKDEFLAMLAHELRNPLAPISNSLQILKLTDDLSPATKAMRDIMERQTNQLVRLVDDLLEVSRITRGKIELRKEPVRLAAIIANAVDTSRACIEAAGHQLAISVCPEPVVLEADAVRLAQVISNLLNNAARYTDEGGQIWLTARSENGQAVISVRDTGVGIPPALIPRVFDMFAQLDGAKNRSRGGLGIGLALAHMLVGLHDGEIEAISDGIGKGSEFVVRLPLATSESSVSTKPTLRGDSRDELHSHKVLVVDDTRAAAYMLGKLLERLGQQVTIAYSGDEAIGCLENGLRPDIIISDIAMPQIDGLELARRVREMPELEGVILAALTGYGQDSDKRQTKNAGFNLHLVKPVSLDALREMLGSLPAKAHRL